LGTDEGFPPPDPPMVTESWLQIALTKSGLTVNAPSTTAAASADQFAFATSGSNVVGAMVLTVGTLNIALITAGVKVSGPSARVASGLDHIASVVVGVNTKPPRTTDGTGTDQLAEATSGATVNAPSNIAAATTDHAASAVIGLSVVPVTISSTKSSLNQLDAEPSGNNSFASKPKE